MGAVSANGERMDGPVALVIQRRVADEGFAAFSRWNGKLGERLKSWPGFLAQEVVPPQPPAKSDWIVIQRFATPTTPHAWWRSDEPTQHILDLECHVKGR